eukprot:NODE_2344_length_1607_cov_42.306604_g2014_i0.p1 GENE.NODE_2344_length_1607_cov_42.306604_g2014_i0~~NODE_2344_length_1607_cov_42.306604_g2014_i0.p1  ORF type:complete len:377 (-),score=64.31 NODE_2344_length_1607_cov_42.306604_g2014_i0:476-1525(-)
MALFMIGNILNFLSFAYAAQTMLAAIGSIQFVSNVFLACWLLGEPITCLTLLGTALIVLGNIVVVAFGSHADIQYSVIHLHKIFTGSKYGWYLLVAGVAFVVLTLVQSWLKHRINTTPETNYKIVAMDYNNNKEDDEPIVSGNMSNHKLVRLYAIIYIINGGIVGTQAVTYAKALSTVLRVVSRGDTRWLDITETRFTYYVFGVWVACMAFWLWRRDRVLKQHDAMFIVPVLQVVWISLSIAQGGVYFNEFQGYTFSQSMLFALGIAILLIGVGVLALSHIEPPDKDEDPENSPLQGKEDYSISIQLDVDSISKFPDGGIADVMRQSLTSHVSLGLATSLPMGLGASSH